jgi:hypothetical protein
VQEENAESDGNEGVDTDAGSGTLTPPPQQENITDNSPAPGETSRFLSFFKFVKTMFQKVLFYHPELRKKHISYLLVVFEISGLRG